MIPRILFIGGLMVIAFAAGIVARQLETFPIPLLRNAQEAWLALQSVEETQPIDNYAFPTEFETSGVFNVDAERAFESYTFITAYVGDRCSNFLLDMDGNVVHEWFVPYSDVWEKAPFLLHQADDSWTCWHGAHLFPNGDVILGFAGTGFPEGWGTVKLDKDSNILWKIPRNTHHDVTVDDDGLVYIPSVRYHQERVPSLNVNAGPDGIGRTVWEPPLEEDTIVVADADGNVIEEFSVLGAILNSEYRSLLSVNQQKRISTGARVDPTHLNNIEIVTADWAETLPQANAGDLLVSLRNISALVLIDRESKLAKWALTGKFIRQHDPDLMSDGSIMIFDNWGAPEETGYTRAMRMDPLTHEILWQYTGSAADPLYTEIRGMLQVLPNGNVLIAETLGGRLLEVTQTTPSEVVWEYRNKILESRSGERVIGIIVNAQKYAMSSLQFIE